MEKNAVPLYEPDWLAFTDTEYYHRCRAIMIGSGMGEGDVEMILANVWEDGWSRRKLDTLIAGNGI